MKLTILIILAIGISMGLLALRFAGAKSAQCHHVPTKKKTTTK